MQVFDNVMDIRTALANQNSGLKIGFVPTMGALHKGHMSLVKLAASENDIVVVSIFVNPTQFNNPDDLKNYPRTLEKDLELLATEKVDFVFVPTVQEVYPDKDLKEVSVDLGLLEHVMEGKHRPGHFKGVVEVVNRLFEMIHPDRAYFGTKDFQQLAVIREMTKQLGFHIEIRAGETIRDEDGLAMSSRNVLLSPEQRIEVTKISKNLFLIRDNWQHKTLLEACQEAIHNIEKNGLMKVEYLEVADSNTLEPITDWAQSNFPRVFIAVQVGKVRLIDNIGIFKSG
ncbi:MAG TPA: pantoate--beta-alanine ligase [Bacteroidia bacterium]|nr:pantoate--beta-alanine ligase [Bacteroidia bacterium]